MFSQINNLLYITRKVDFLKLELVACQIMTPFLWIKTRFLDLSPRMQPG